MEENRLKIIRDDLGGISQAKLAINTGIPLYKIAYAETNAAKISHEIAKLLSEKFNYNLAWILTGEGPMRGKGESDHGQDKQPSATPIYNKDTLPSAAVVDAQKINIEEAMGKTYSVLTSGTPYAVALYLNIQQFSSAVDATKELRVCRDLIAGMQSQIDDLRHQVNRLTASPTTAEQQKAS